MNAAPLLMLEGLGVPIHHASSLAVSLLSQPPPPTLEAPHSPSWILGCYAQSKWVAERLWERVGNGGSLLRYGLLLGAPGRDDLLTLVVHGLMALGCYPRVGARHLAFDATSLEYAAEATYRHLLEPTSGAVLTVSQRVKVSLQDLVEDLAALGHPLTEVPNEEFFSLPVLEASASVAQLALSRLMPSTPTPPEFDLFLMSETAWAGNGDGSIER